MMQTLAFASLVLAQQNAVRISINEPQRLNGQAGRAFLSTQSQAFNGNTLWRNALPESQVWNLPDYYQDTFQTRTPADFKLPKDSEVVYECPAGGTGPCDVVVFLYECYPCKSEKGGLPAYLVKDMGYERSRCAPTFTAKKGGFHHRMTAYVKTIAAGAVETLKMPGDVEFVFFGMSDSGEGRDCATQNAVQCVNTKDKCLFQRQAQQCQLATCTQKGPGGCNPNTCVYKELGQYATASPTATPASGQYATPAPPTLVPATPAPPTLVPVTSAPPTPFPPTPVPTP